MRIKRTLVLLIGECCREESTIAIEIGCDTDVILVTLGIARAKFDDRSCNVDIIFSAKSFAHKCYKGFKAITFVRPHPACRCYFDTVSQFKGELYGLHVWSNKYVHNRT